MKAFAALILTLVAAVHFGGDLLTMALEYVDQDRASRAIYYVLTAFEGAVLYALVALLALELAMRQPEPAFGWRGNQAAEPARRKAHAIPTVVLVILACGSGMVEHIQAGACRLAIGIENRTPAGKPLTGLCDDVTGLPMYALGMAAVAFIAAVIAAYSLGEKNA